MSFLEDLTRSILDSPSPNVLIMALGESAIELELRFWIADAQNGVHNVKSEVFFGIWRLFQRGGIHIPYPKRDLYLRSSATLADERAAVIDWSARTHRPDGAERSEGSRCIS
jgi:small-conductance mechanosensitive channel